MDSDSASGRVHERAAPHRDETGFRDETDFREKVGLHDDVGTRDRDDLVDALAVCPGRSDAQRRELFAALVRTRAALERSCGVDWPLAKLARLAGLSPTHYLRVYRRVFGSTPHEHATQLRMNEAYRRLASGVERVAAVGRALGFSNRCAFARAFRAYHGLAPSRVRRRAGAASIPHARGALLLEPILRVP